MLALISATCLGALATSLSTADAVAPHAAVHGAGLDGAGRARVDDPVAVLATTALADVQTYIATDDMSILDRYAIERNQIAAALAARLEIDPVLLINAWQIADMPHQVALMAAFTQLGVPYHGRMSKPGAGFDCSGLTMYAWGIAHTDLPHQSASQIRMIAPRTADTAMAGDIVYYPGHVMLYLGVPDTIVHSPNSGNLVRVDNIGRNHGTRFGNPNG